MLNVTEIRLDITKNLGNYESKKIGATAALEEGANVTEALKELERVLLGEYSAEVKAEGAKKESIQKPKATKSEKQVEGEVKKSEEKAPVKEETKTVQDESVKEEKAEETAKEEKKKKTIKSKDEAYDRKNDVHKKLVSGMLDSEIADWKSPVNLPKASKASTELVGAPFLGEDGEILPSFKEKFISYFK